MTPSSKPAHDERPVGTLALLALGVNGIVGVGIFFAPSVLAAQAPGASVAVFALTPLALAPIALCFATLGRRFDVDGGPVVFAREAFGELTSFAIGWVSYLSAVTSTAAVMAGLTNALAPSLGLDHHLEVRAASAGIVTLLAAICAGGISLSARVWTALTVLKLVPLVALAGAFLIHDAPSHSDPAPAVGQPNWGRAALTATFAYQGFEIVPVVAGQARSSRTAMPIAVLGSLGFAALLYVVLQSACVAALPHLAASPIPLVEAARVYGGPELATLVGIGTSVSALGIAFGQVAMTPRYLSALAAGGSLAGGLDRMARNGVPLRSLAVTWALVVALLQAGGLTEAFALASVVVLLQFLVTALSLAALARRREKGLGSHHLWIAMPAALLALTLVAGASAREWLVAGGGMVLGLILRALRRERKASS